MIYEHRPDKAGEIGESIQEYLKQRADIRIEHATNSRIKFFTDSIDILPKMENSEWVKSGRILLWEIRNADQQIQLRLVLGPGDQDVREAVYELAKRNPTIFGDIRRKLSQKRYRLYFETWISGKQYENAESEEIIELIDEKLTKLLIKRNVELAAKLNEIRIFA